MSAGLKPEKYAISTKEYASYEEAVQLFVKLINLDAGEAKKHLPARIAQSALPFQSESERWIF